MQDEVPTLIVKSVGISNNGIEVVLKAGLVYILASDLHLFLIRHGVGLPFKSYHPNVSNECVSG